MESGGKRKPGSRRWQGSRQETGRARTSVSVVGTDGKRDIREILLRKEEPDALCSQINYFIATSIQQALFLISLFLGSQ